MEKCPDCGSNRIDVDNDTGEKTCHYCGLVLEESVNLGYDAYDDGDGKNRRSDPPGNYLNGNMPGSTF